MKSFALVTAGVIILVLSGVIAVQLAANDDVVRYEPSILIPDETELPHRSATSCTRGSREARAKEALSKVDYDWENLAYTINFEGPKRGYLGKVSFAKKEVTVWMRACQSSDSIAHVLGHEFGHAVDHEFNTAERRAEWLSLRGIAADTDWYPGCYCEDYGYGSGDFAEAFASLKTPHALAYRSQLAPPPEASADLERFFH